MKVCKMCCLAVEALPLSIKVTGSRMFIICLLCDSFSKEKQRRYSKQKSRNFIDHDILCPLGFWRATKSVFTVSNSAWKLCPCIYSRLALVVRVWVCLVCFFATCDNQVTPSEDHVTSYWTKADLRPNQNCGNLAVGWITVRITGSNYDRWKNKFLGVGAACVRIITFLWWKYGYVTVINQHPMLL